MKRFHVNIALLIPICMADGQYILFIPGQTIMSDRGQQIIHGIILEIMDIVMMTIKSFKFFLLSLDQPDKMYLSIQLQWHCVRLFPSE